MLVQVLLAVGGAVVVGVLVVWALAVRQRKTRAPRPFALPTDAKRAMWREAEFKKMSEKFKDPLWDDQGDT